MNKEKDYCVKAAFLAIAIGKASGVRRHGAGGIGKYSYNNNPPDECHCDFCSRKRKQTEQRLKGQQQQFWSNRTKDLKRINAEYDKRIRKLPYEKTVRLLKLMDKS